MATEVATGDRMSIKVSKLIEYLQKMPQDLEIFACHGASGSVDEVSSPHVEEASIYDTSMGLDLEIGEKYVSLYTGN